MAKTNYTKVEEALNEGMLKMTMQQLHSLVDGKTDEAKQDQGKLLALLKLDLRWIAKTDPSLFSKLDIKKEEIKNFFDNPTLITSEDWKNLIQLKTQIDQLKKELIASQPSESNEQLIEKERVKHVNKRFNTNDKWLPLH